MLFKRINELNNSIDEHFKTLETALDWPRLNLKENYLTTSDQEKYEIRVSLPGHTKETVSAVIDKGSIFIKASSEKEQPLIANETFRFKLPKDCDMSSDSIDAEMENGILTIKLPKIKEVKNLTEIKIK